MPAAPKQYQVRWSDGTVRIVMGHSLRGAARIFVTSFAVNKGDIFKVRERLGGSAWTVFTRTKTGIRELGEMV